jgi:hypothetical protein
MAELVEYFNDGRVPPPKNLEVVGVAGLGGHAEVGLLRFCRLLRPMALLFR